MSSWFSTSARKKAQAAAAAASEGVPLVPPNAALGGVVQKLYGSAGGAKDDEKLCDEKLCPGLQICFVFKAEKRSKDDKKSKDKTHAVSKEDKEEEKRQKKSDANKTLTKRFHRVKEFADRDNLIKNLEVHLQYGDCDEDLAETLLRFTSLNFSLFRHLPLSSLNPLSWFRSAQSACKNVGKEISADAASVKGCCHTEAEDLLHSKKSRSCISCCEADIEGGVQMTEEVASEAKKTENWAVVKDIKKDGCCTCCSSDEKKSESAPLVIKDVEADVEGGCCGCCGKSAENPHKKKTAAWYLRELEKAEKMVEGCITSTELVHFVLFQPYEKSLRSRAELDKTSVMLDAKLALKEHSSFYDKYFDENQVVHCDSLNHKNRDKVLAFKKLGAMEEELESDASGIAKTWNEVLFSFINSQRCDNFSSNFSPFFLFLRNILKLLNIPKPYEKLYVEYAAESVSSYKSQIHTLYINGINAICMIVYFYINKFLFVAPGGSSVQSPGGRATLGSSENEDVGKYVE